jgi:putative DNA methylase
MTDHPVKRRKKLIEVAIPLEAINAASAREKSIRHGHPSTLHLWWARRPLAAARAVIFCQMVDDPSAVPEEFPTEEAQENERLRLFALISELVTWENTTNEKVLNRAREEIRRSWRRCCTDNADHPEAAELFNPEKLPGFHDPFAGGGTMPLAAQRLGLESHASDLNPVSVLINKAMIEIPPKYFESPPAHPEARNTKSLLEKKWIGAEGLAEDVRYYGRWMRDEAEKRIGNFYPKIFITHEMVAERPDLKQYEEQERSVIAWIWARTVNSPNPAFSNKMVPLISTYYLCNKKGKEVYLEPRVTGSDYELKIKAGLPPDTEAVKQGTKHGRGSFKCILSSDIITTDYIRAESTAGRISEKLIAIIAEGNRERIYVAPPDGHVEVAQSAKPNWKPDINFFEKALGFRVSNYGMRNWSDVFTDRQLLCIDTLCQLVNEVANRVAVDSEALANMTLNAQSLKHDEHVDYGAAVSTYLALAISKVADRNSRLSKWDPTPTQSGILHTFSLHALPMAWDFAESNPLGSASGSFLGGIDLIAKVLDGMGGGIAGKVYAIDAAKQCISELKVVSTDPPYYDNIGYADLSDFFYVWLRRSLREIHPALFKTVAVPKAEELVATPIRNGSKEEASKFFLEGMTSAMRQISKSSHPCFPCTIYYAFKQSESSNDGGTRSTGWETFLQAVINSGFAITGTWPVRTELSTRTRGLGSNALATSVVLACSKISNPENVLSLSEFKREIRKRISEAIRAYETSGIAPVDIAQAAIGPGMSVYSTAKDVLNPDDRPMMVSQALIEINTALDEYLSEDEGGLDSDTRFALTFFESYGYSVRDFGDAENLAKARNVSVSGIAESGILSSVAGKVNLLRRSELEENWDPSKDNRLCIWEATQQLIRSLEANGEGAAASLLSQLKQISGHGDLAANCKALAYRLYNHCEKTKQAEEARSYNGLVTAWEEIERQASNQPTETTVQASLI